MNKHVTGRGYEQSCHGMCRHYVSQQESNPF